MTVRSSVKFLWMNLYCEFYDGPRGLEMWELHLLVIPLYTDDLESPVNEA